MGRLPREDFLARGEGERAEKYRSVGEDDFSAQKTQREARPTGPGLASPKATDKGISIYLSFTANERPKKQMQIKGSDQQRYRKSPAIRSFNIVFRFSTAILRMA